MNSCLLCLLIHQSNITEYQYVNVVITDPTFVVCAYHQCIRLLHHVNCECLVVDVFECAVNHRIVLTTCFQYTFVQFDILHTHSTTLNHHNMRYTLDSIMHHVFLMHQAIYLRSKSYEFSDTMIIVFILVNRSWQFLIEIKE